MGALTSTAERTNWAKTFSKVIRPRTNLAGKARQDFNVLTACFLPMHWTAFSWFNELDIILMTFVLRYKLTHPYLLLRVHDGLGKSFCILYMFNLYRLKASLTSLNFSLSEGVMVSLSEAVGMLN